MKPNTRSKQEDGPKQDRPKQDRSKLKAFISKIEA